MNKLTPKLFKLNFEDRISTVSKIVGPEGAMAPPETKKLLPLDSNFIFIN